MMRLDDNGDSSCTLGKQRREEGFDLRDETDIDTFFSYGMAYYYLIKS